MKKLQFKQAHRTLAVPTAKTLIAHKVNTRRARTSASWLEAPKIKVRFLKAAIFSVMDDKMAACRLRCATWGP